MKNLFILLTLMMTSSAFAGEMPWKNEIHYNGWLMFDSCYSKMVSAIKKADNDDVRADLQRAVDVIAEVKRAESDEKLREFIADMNIAGEVSTKEVALEVFDTDFYGELCYAGDIQGYGVLKHIVKSNLMK